MFSIYKNSYLQSNFKEINPRLLNRCVQKAREYSWADVHDLEPPFNRLVSEHPNLPVQNVDSTHRPLAYGRLAIPKLRRELHHKDEEVVIAALLSLCDLCHDPEKAYEAVNLKIIDRMVPLVLHQNAAIRERTANALQILARHTVGSQAIAANQSLLDNIQISIEDPYPEIRIHIATLLEMLARSWIVADMLVTYGFIPIILANLLNEDPNILVINLELLKSLMYGDGKCIAIESDGFFIFLKLLHFENPDIISKACDCLTLLTTSRIGEKLAQEMKLLETLNILLHDERKEVYTSAASTIMFCTVKTVSKIAAAKIKKMVPRLIAIAKNRENPDTQIFAVKALTNICEHPDVRKEVNNNYLEEVINIQLGAEPFLKEYKEILLRVINWVPTTVS
ncbi:hypothetical protein NQ315_007528 [Exocentrus adspersus]|uniref:Rhabdoid tumor deletion region protein 1 n=1 Tax=Exocentrus adspersus TaxID=1586481 RepID=A0AAV8W7U9_9CUCU|nr:hypothetical protein NQ315_007528 [Exocentrus adspersus]